MHGGAEGRATGRWAPIIEVVPLQPDIPLLGRGVLEVNGSPVSFPFEAASEWRVIVTADGVPCAYPHVASPGDEIAPDAAEALLVRYATPHVLLRQEEARLRARLGAPPPRPPPHPSVSVVICTRRRPEIVRGALEAIAQLQPGAHEVLVVDNDPGDLGCREVAEEYGARYIREETAGLDRARRRGLVEARGEIVAYMDDDCRPSPGWLARVGLHFDDPTVGALTGPAFAEELDTPSRDTRERLLSFVHGFELRRYDWLAIPPARSGQAGAGANMMFRRNLALALGEIFPLELDLGTPTLGGGDIYALYRVLSAGRRVVYDPACWMYHRHPPDPASLAFTARMWGVGFAAFLTKVVVEQREWPAIPAWWWLVRQYGRSVLWTLPAPDPVVVRIQVHSLGGGLTGAVAWLRARRFAREPISPPLPSPTTAAEETTEPSVAGVEIIRADDPVARNAAARASSAEVLVFLDEEARPVAGLAAAHRAAHAAGAGTLVIGCERARTPAVGLTAQLCAIRLDERSHLRAGSLALTVADVPSSNLSIERELFQRLGGFDERLTGARCGQDLAVRALAAGGRLAHAPDAHSERTVPTSVKTVLAGARRAGEETALLARRHPELAGALNRMAPRLGPGRAAASGTLGVGVDRVRRLVPAIASILERGRLRGSWLRLVETAESAAYARGWRAGGGRRLEPHVLVLDLASDSTVPPPRVGAPLVDVRIGDMHVARLRPRYGCWHPDLAEQVIRALNPKHRRALARTRGRVDVEAAPPAAGTWGVVVCKRADAALPQQDVVARPRRWEDVDCALRMTQREIVAILLPDVRMSSASFGWLRHAFAGERVAMVVGAGVAPGEHTPPVMTISRRMRRRRYDPIGPGFQYMAVARAAYERVGGLDPQVSALGPQAAILDLIERMLDAGFVVAHADVPGVSPAGTIRPARSWLKWQSTRGRGRLLTRRGFEIGGASGVWLVAVNALLPQAATLAGALRGRREPSLRHWTGTTAGAICGALEQLVREAAAQLAGAGRTTSGTGRYCSSVSHTPSPRSRPGSGTTRV